MGSLLLSFQLAVLGISVQKNGLGAPAGSNSAWHFFVLPLQISYDNQPGDMPCSALVLVVPVLFDIGSVAQDSPQLSATHQPTVEITKHKMPSGIQVPVQIQLRMSPVLCKAQAGNDWDGLRWDFCVCCVPGGLPGLCAVAAASQVLLPWI